jgi:hypothetical protein
MDKNPTNKLVKYLTYIILMNVDYEKPITNPTTIIHRLSTHQWPQSTTKVEQTPTYLQVESNHPRDHPSNA